MPDQAATESTGYGPRRYLSAADIAAEWGVSSRTALRWITAGRFGPMYGAGQVLRVTVAGYE